MFEGYLKLGENELGNWERTRGYAETGDCPIRWLEKGECNSLSDVLGDTVYERGAISMAPWYDSDVPESGRFYGAHIISVKGDADSTRERGITEGVTNGGVAGRERRAGRQFRVRAWLTAAGGSALDYGMGWLDRALSGAQCTRHGASCAGADLEFFAECPPERSLVPDISEWAIAQTNIVPNPSFERTNSTPTGVARQNLATPIREATRASFTPANGAATAWDSDRAAMRVTPASAQSQSGVRVFGSPAAPGVSYTISVTIESQDGGTYGITGTGGWLQGASEFTLAAGEKRRIEKTFTTGGPTGSIYVVRMSAGSGGPFWLTQALVELRPGPAQPYFDGDTTDQTRAVYSWDGAAGASTSSMRAPLVEVYRNQVPNPSFETVGDRVEIYRNYFSDPGATGAARFTSYAGTTGNTKNDGNPNPSPTPIWWSTSGTVRRTRWTAVASPDTGDFGVQVGSQGGVALVGAGETWTIEYDIATSRTLSVNAPVPYASSGTYTTIARSHSAASTVPAGYPEHRWVTFTADQTAIDNGLRIIQNPLGKQVDDYVEIGNVELYPGARRGVPFFSGAAAPKLRRNFFPDPEATNLANFAASASQATVSHTGSAVRYTFVGNVAAGLGLPGYAPIQGVGYRLLVRARASKAFPAQLRIGNTTGPTVQMKTTWDWYDLTAVAGNGTIYQTGFLLQAGTGYGADDWLEIDRVLIAPTGDTGPWWGPSSTPEGLLVAYEGAVGSSFLYLTDPDFIPGWTGTANGSPSIISVDRPSGAGDNGIWSSRWAKRGSRSLRVMGTGTSPDTFSAVGGGSGGMRLGMQAGKTYTALATARLLAPQSYAPDTRARRIVVFHRATAGAGYSTIMSDQVPNVAGETQLRMVFELPAGTIEAFVRLYSGAPRDGGEIYWDSFALVEGDYYGGYFDGQITPDADLTPTWVNGVTTGPSALMGVQVAGIGQGGRPIQVFRSGAWHSTGDYSARLTSTSTTVQPTTYGHVPLSLVDGVTYTATARVWIPAPLTGPLRPERMCLQVRDSSGQIVATSEPPPNEAGAHDVRVTFVQTGPAEIRMYHGGVAGSGDVWFDDLLVVEGAYDGSYFDGFTTPEDPEMQRYSWVGAANASSSIYEARYPFERMQTDEEYEATVRPLRRYAHDVKVISGPLEIATRESSDGIHVGREVEYTLYAEQGWIYGKPEPVSIPPILPVVVDDIPVNLVPYPSAELGVNEVTVAVNHATNPSLELDAVGWSGARYAGDGTATVSVSGSRVVGERAFSGTASYRLRIAGSATATAGQGSLSALVEYQTSLAGLTAGSTVSLHIWGALVFVSGPSALPDSSAPRLSAVYRFYNAAGAPLAAAATIASAAVSEFGGRAFSLANVTIPSGAASVRVGIDVMVPVRNSTTPELNSDVRVYADAVAVTVP